MQPRASDQVGRYKILSELGRGSMARVFLALDPNIEREIALKVFEPRSDLPPEQRRELRRRFVLEAKAAGRVHHPGIVTIFDADTDPAADVSYIAMECIDGQSLRGVLAEQGALSESRAIEIAGAIAMALEAAHEKGLVHLDIKPGNILCGLDGSLKVTDFGTAQLASGTSGSTGWIAGSPFYMSPEQLQDGEVDRRSDVYSLGAVLYECLTGVVPFTSESMAGLIYMIREIDPRPLQTFDSGVRDAVAAVALRALAKSPADRYATTREMAQALADAISPPSAKRPVDALHLTGIALPARPDAAPDAVRADAAALATRVTRSAAPVSVTLLRGHDGASPSPPPIEVLPRPVAAASFYQRSATPGPVEATPATIRLASPSPAGSTAPTGPTSTAPARRPLRWLTALLSIAVCTLAIHQVRLIDTSAAVIAAPTPATPATFSFEPTARYSADKGGEVPEFVRSAPEPPAIERADDEERAREARIRARNRAETAATIEEPRHPTVADVVTVQTLAAELASAAALDGASKATEPPPPSIAPGTLEIVFRNRLKSGSITVSIDGKTLWTHHISGAKNPLRRTVGKDIGGSLAVPAGEHSIEVRVTGGRGKIDLVRQTAVTLDGGETRRLRVALVPPRGLKLSWKGGSGD